MNISGPFIRRPVATVLLSVGLMIAGIIAYFDLPVANLPNVDLPTLNVRVNWVTPGYVETLGIELVAGRGFGDTDAEGAAPVVVINQTLAERLWPGESPIGRLVQQPFMPEPAEVVGVTSDGRYQFVTEEPTPFVFLPYLQAPRAEMAIHARAPGAEAATLRAIRCSIAWRSSGVSGRGSWKS